MFDAIRNIFELWLKTLFLIINHFGLCLLNDCKLTCEQVAHSGVIEDIFLTPQNVKHCSTTEQKLQHCPLTSYRNFKGFLCLLKSDTYTNFPQSPLKEVSWVVTKL